MSFLGKIFGSGIGEVATGIGSLAISLRTAITGVDPAKKAELDRLLVELEGLGQQAQTEVNKIEAGHKSIFVAGWRPFVGWVCGFGLGYQFIALPLIGWAMAVWSPEIIPPPQLNIADLLTLLAGMLGFGAMRTWEKKNDVQDKH